jgi:hypothetical protein
MQLLMSDPALAEKLKQPRVQAALAEISQSPWKTLKYVFDRDVMDVFKVRRVHARLEIACFV